MHHPVHKSLKAAYSFYNIHTETPLLDLMNDALIIAKVVSCGAGFFPASFTKLFLGVWAR